MQGGESMIENYKDFKKFITTLEYTPKLLLHSCCAPCSSHVLILLKAYFDITVFYSNDNIYPEEEYLKRLDEEMMFCNQLDPEIKVIYDTYKKEDYDQIVKGYETLGERSQRCYACYKLRLEKTASKAKALGFDFFTTTLSISPYKNSQWINEIGQALEKKYGVSFLYSDFKKEEGYKHSIALSKTYHLYRQEYCGCQYSLEERMKQDGKE